jgi:hypothetical protein
MIQSLTDYQINCGDMAVAYAEKNIDTEISRNSNFNDFESVAFRSAYMWLGFNGVNLPFTYVYKIITEMIDKKVNDFFDKKVNETFLQLNAMKGLKQHD